MGSTRLPGKVLMPLAGRPALFHTIERVQRANLINEIVIATSTLPQDDIIEKEAAFIHIKTFRGSEGDVLERYYLAAKEANADTVVRVTSDCPLIDPAVLDQLIELFKETNADYASNFFARRTYPRGLDAEVFTFKALEHAQEKATQKHEREHVTPFIWAQPKLFKCASLQQDKDLSTLRWTLDEKDDYRLLTEIFNTLYPQNPNFSTEDILTLLEKRPELKTLNEHVEQKKVLANP